MPNRYIQYGDNPELANERRDCQFDTDELASRIYGSKQVVQARHRILKAVESEPELADAVQDLDTSFMSRLEKFECSYQRTVLAERHIDRIINRDDPIEYGYYQQLVNGGTHGNPFLLTHAIVLAMLENSADDEQREMFLKPAKRHEFCSAYAQTELGHGTNTKRLETTATYDPNTEQFILNSPSTTSLKWWPGNLGKAASLVLVMADLRINSKSYGMHPFFVRIRDENTHELVPGVLAGDIGPTFANNTNDNGFLGFKNFRVPRRSMLMKHFKVYRDGTYEAGIHPRLAYTGMMFVRAFMPFGLGIDLAAGVVIAIRYSLVRRQGEITPRQEEVKLLDYKTQQYRILPQLARAVCFCLVGHSTITLYNKVMADIENGDASQLAELHAVTSGLKSVCSYQASVGIEQCRLACGGHGYSLASGLPQILTRLVAGNTYEGDNMVMLLQLGRYLAKCAREVRSGRNSNGSDKSIMYLYETHKMRSNFDSKVPKEQQWQQIQEAFEHLSQRIIMKTFDSLEVRRRQDKQEVAWNKVSVQMTKAARAHTRTVLSRIFVRAVQDEQNHQIRIVLGDLLSLYLYYELLECRGDLLEDNFICSTQLNQIRELLNGSLSRVRLNALNIADSFDIPDRILASVLGRRDGHVYENLIKFSQRSELNKTSVLPFHHETLGRMNRERQTASKL